MSQVILHPDTLRVQDMSHRRFNLLQSYRRSSGVLRAIATMSIVVLVTAVAVAVATIIVVVSTAAVSVLVVVVVE